MTVVNVNVHTVFTPARPIKVDRKECLQLGGNRKGNS